MAFNHRFQDINALDTYSLVKLMSEPQKAAELWERYVKARELYESHKASIAAEDAKLNERLVVVEAGEKSLTNDKLLHERQVASFKSQVVAWELKRDSVEKTAADRSLDLDGRELRIVKANVELVARAAEVETWLDKLHIDEVEFDKHADAKVKELEVREAAVAKREEKADKLAELVKGL